MNRFQGKDLKKLVKDFKYNDLKHLLMCLKKNSKGRKNDLLEQVLKLIDTSSLLGHPESSILEKKIIEITKKNGIEPLLKDCLPASSNTRLQSSRVSAPNTNRAKKSLMETDSLHNVAYSPNVTLKSLPFYDFITELMKPTAIITKSDIGHTHYARYVFSLTPAQVKHIRESELLTNDCVVEYKQQVLLRFCLAEVTSNQEDNYPKDLVVHVNGKIITLPSYNVPSNATVQPKRPSRPLDITFACVLNPVNMNDIHLTWSKDPMQNHCFTVILANRLNCEILLKRLRQFSYRHPDHTRALVKEKLAASLDSEISFTCLKICLLCPLSKMKMKVPIRSVSCNHLQCFDAATFLQMNEKKPTWTCPICDKPTRYDSLIVDGLFLEILDQAPNSTEIQFLEDGSWKDMQSKKNDSKLSTSVLCYEIADSPKSSDSKETIVLESKDAKHSKEDAATAGAGGAEDMDMIDLTGDSDEEEDISYEPTIDSAGYVSSTSSSSLPPYDLSKKKKKAGMKMVESVFSPDLPFLDPTHTLLFSPTYNEPPDLSPM